LNAIAGPRRLPGQRASGPSAQAEADVSRRVSGVMTPADDDVRGGARLGRHDSADHGAAAVPGETP
jgi:hypothetical protein